MRSSTFASQSLLTVAALLLGGAFVACAPTTGSTAITAGDVANTPVKHESTAAPATTDAAPGKLECTTKNIQEGTSELFLDWKGKSATGILRRIAPSGETTVTNVRAERYKGHIIADDTLSTDLVTHAAVIAEHQGKLHMRIGDWKQPWSRCE